MVKLSVTAEQPVKLMDGAKNALEDKELVWNDPTVFEVLEMCVGDESDEDCVTRSNLTLFACIYSSPLVASLRMSDNISLCSSPILL